MESMDTNDTVVEEEMAEVDAEEIIETETEPVDTQINTTAVDDEKFDEDSDMTALFAAAAPDISDDDEETAQNDGEDKPSNSTSTKLVQLPITRIKQIIKLDEDIDRVTAEAVFVVTKATELFLQSFAKEIYKFTARSKKKTIQMRDVNACIDDVCCMQFLEGIFPQN